MSQCMLSGLMGYPDNRRGHLYSHVMSHLKTWSFHRLQDVWSICCDNRFPFWKWLCDKCLWLNWHQNTPSMDQQMEVTFDLGDLWAVIYFVHIASTLVVMATGFQASDDCFLFQCGLMWHYIPVSLDWYWNFKTDEGVSDISTWG